MGQAIRLSPVSTESVLPTTIASNQPSTDKVACMCGPTAAAAATDRSLVNAGSSGGRLPWPDSLATVPSRGFECPLRGRAIPIPTLYSALPPQSTMDNEEIAVVVSLLRLDVLLCPSRADW